jgi:cytochrome c-type biogenesis protein
MMGAVSWARRHQQGVMRLGGAMLVTVGVLMLTGLWAELVAQLQLWVVGYVPPV